MCRILVHFHKNAVASGCHGRARQQRCEVAVARSRVAGATWALHGMGGIKNHAVAGFTNPGQRAEVCHEIIITKGGAAFGEQELFCAKFLQLLRDKGARN